MAQAPKALTELASRSSLALVDAAVRGDLQQVQQLLIAGADANAVHQDDGRTALHAAIAAADTICGVHQAVIELLLKHGAAVNTRDQAGHTPLHTASGAGSSLLVHLLLERGAPVNTLDKAGQTPLHAAVSAAVSREGGPYRVPHLSVLRLLLDRDAQVNTTDESGHTPLHTAAQGGSAALVNLLLAHGAQATAVNQAGETPLHGAALKGYVEVARLLIDYDNGTATSRGQDGRTPLHAAAQHGHWPVVQLLLESGAQVTCQDAAGKTALHVAAWAGQFWVVYYLLRSYGEPGELLGALDQRGQTPLHAAAMGGNGLVVQLLLRQGLPQLVHQQDKDGRTPLMCAACLNQSSAVQLLLAGGADPDTRDNEGRTPLHWAAYLHHLPVAKVLADANLEVVDQDGRTPLHAAASMGHVALAQMLLERGANPYAVNKEGQTLVETATIGGNTALLQLIRSCMQPAKATCSPAGSCASTVSNLREDSAIAAKLRQVPAVLVFPAASRQLPSVSGTAGSAPSASATSSSSAARSAGSGSGNSVARIAVASAAAEAAAAAGTAAAGAGAGSVFAGGWPAGLTPPPPAVNRKQASPMQPATPAPATPFPPAVAAPTPAAAELPARKPIAASAFVGFWPPGMEPPPLAPEVMSEAGSSLLTPWDGPSREISISMPSTCIEVEPEELPDGKLIGEGAFGVVSKCTWSGRQVAVKRFPGRSLSTSVIRSFKTEVGTLSNLHHPNIVEFLGAVVKPPKLAIITEFVRRGSLYALLHSSKVDLDPQRRLSIARDIAGALLYLHTRRPAVVHRDLKSANILIAHDWSAKVCDFGMSQMLREAFLSARSQLGTFAWAAPEAFGSSDLNEKCDVYSYGVVLWELLTGQTPWAGLSFPQIAMAVAVHGERLPMPPDVDPRLASIMRDCWAAEPSARPGFDVILNRLYQLSEICPSRPSSHGHGNRQPSSQLLPKPAVVSLPGNGLAPAAAEPPLLDQAHLQQHTPPPLPPLPISIQVPQPPSSSSSRRMVAGMAAGRSSPSINPAAPATPLPPVLMVARASDACLGPATCSSGAATQPQVSCHGAGAGVRLARGGSSGSGGTGDGAASEQLTTGTWTEDDSSTSLASIVHEDLSSSEAPPLMGDPLHGSAACASGSGLRTCSNGCSLPAASKTAARCPQLCPPATLEICATGAGCVSTSKAAGRPATCDGPCSGGWESVATQPPEEQQQQGLWSSVWACWCCPTGGH